VSPPSGLQPSLPPLLVAALRWGLVAVTAVTLLSVGLLASVHVADRYQIGWVEGTRMALARSADSGVLYPPLHADGFVGGTRFMPIPILLHAAVASVTGEYLTSGKLASLIATAFLLAVTFYALRRSGCPLVAAGALTASILATRPGFHAATTIQGDTLPVALQVAAIMVVSRSTRMPAVLGSSALVALAMMSKLSAVWAPIAILVWLLARDRRRVPWFLGSLVLLLTASVGVFQWISGGRMVQNLAAVSLSGIEGLGALAGAPFRLVSLLQDGGPVLVVLFPLAILGTMLAASRNELTIFHFALGAALAVLLPMVADEGVLTNHVLDVVVLTVLCVGVLMSAANREGEQGWMAPAIALAILWSTGLFLTLTVRPDVIRALRTGSEGYSTTPLAPTIAVDEPFLSEDPAVPVLMDRTPVVLDAWVLLRLEADHPEWIRELADRIERREFDTIVLANPIEFRAWYSTVHFGDTIATAIRTHYRLLENRPPYYLYVPIIEET
jgi:hypothetical protein